MVKLILEIFLFYQMKNDHELEENTEITFLVTTDNKWTENYTLGHVPSV